VDIIYPEADADSSKSSYFVAVRRRRFGPFEMMDGSMMQEGSASRAVKKAFNIGGDLKAFMLA